jgi:hypothetical protein
VELDCGLIFINYKWVFTWWQWFTIRHNKQTTHITQNDSMIKRNTAHKTTHTIKDTLHRIVIRFPNVNIFLYALNSVEWLRWEWFVLCGLPETVMQRGGKEKKRRGFCR